jgi:hypothetical protein
MDDINNWLQSQEKDYTQGVNLFEKHHKNRMLAKYFRNGNPATHSKKLEYELKKLSGIPLTVLFAENVPEQKTHSVAIAQLPEVIKQAKRALYELFTEISTSHRHLFETGESNSEDIVKQRKEILQKRLPLIQRYEQIYLLKEQYFATGVVPFELPRLIKEYANTEPETPHACGDYNFQFLSGVELMKKKQALTVAINKIQNRLKYQSLTKSDTPNPMPDCPLKEKMVSKLAELKEDYKKIQQLIEEKK